MLLNTSRYNDYNIMSAIRGPDDEVYGHADVVKRFATCRLRYMVGCDPRRGGIVRNWAWEPERLCELMSSIRMIVGKAGMSHYIIHLQDAFESVCAKMEVEPELRSQAQIMAGIFDEMYEWHFSNDSTSETRAASVRELVQEVIQMENEYHENLLTR